ncbi:MAG: restriction endonuclease [Methanomassiliicoccaceae archaeon]|nr:restriction endonuclease [Methanomassiliicoccaceae archaeon]
MKTLYTEGLDSEGFVKLCEDIFSAFYKSKTKRSFLFDDGNTDFVVLSNNNIAVDCKHPAKAPVGKPAVEKFSLAMKKKKVKEGIIVTSGRFASTAQKYIDENNLPVTLMDLERLAAIAFKAGIKLVYKKEEPEAFTIISNSDREFKEHLAKKLKQDLQCSEEIGLNLSIKRRDISLVLFYKIDYRVDAEFTASGKVIHKETGEGSFYVSERTGKIEGEDFAKVYDMAPRMAYDPEGKDAALLKPRKQILDALYDRVQDAHTKYVPYMAKPDKLSTKTCSPSKKDITIQNIMCLYLPLSDVEYEMFGKSRTIRSLESSSAEFSVIEPKAYSCDICGGKIAKDGAVCVKCGNVTDGKHGVRCSRCSKTLCTNCALAISKFLGKKEPICGECANKEPGLKIKDYK